MKLFAFCFLIRFISQLGAVVLFPDANLNGNPLIWRNGMPPRIEHPELCRSRPPIMRNSSIGSASYILAYLNEGNCRYVMFETGHYDGYEMKVTRGLTDYSAANCKPGVSPNNEQICLMNVVDSQHIVVFCVRDSQTVVGYLMEIQVLKNVKSLNVIHQIEWRKYDKVKTNHFLGLIRFTAGADIVLAGNSPSFIIHIRFDAAGGKFVNWIGGDQVTGAEEVNNYYQQVLHWPAPNFSKCPYTGNDESYCEFNGKDIVPILGAFNHVNCLRIRRGLVHYEAYPQMASDSNGNDNYGFIVDPDYKGNNLIAMWSFEQTDEMCQTILDQTPVPQLYSGSICQTAIFPAEARGKYRLVGMEATEEGFPQMAVYNGVDSAPEFIGDPSGLFRNSCYIEENNSPTGFAHFGVYPIDYNHFVVFCNHAYGPKANYSQEHSVTLIYYEYDESVRNLNVATHDVMRIVTDPKSFLRFLDHRGVIMIPTQNRKKIFFLQIMPCALFVLNLSPLGPTFKQRNPNKVANYKCKDENVGQVASAVGVAADQLIKCARKTCVYKEEDKTVEVLESYEPDNYFTEDILNETPFRFVGQYSCLKSYFGKYEQNDGKIIYAYRMGLVVPGDLDPCFAPSHQSAGFHLLGQNNSAEFCKNPFPYAGGVTRTPSSTSISTASITSALFTRPTQTQGQSSTQRHTRRHTRRHTQPTTTLPTTKDPTECISLYIVDTYPAVAFAAFFFMICAAVLGVVVGAAMIGQRLQAAERPRRSSEPTEDWRRMPTYIPTQPTETAGTTTRAGATTVAATTADASAPERQSAPQREPMGFRGPVRHTPEYILPQIAEPKPANNSLIGNSTAAGTTTVKPVESAAAKPAEAAAVAPAESAGVKPSAESVAEP